MGGETAFNSVDIYADDLDVVACGWSTAHELTKNYEKQAVITKVSKAAVEIWSQYFKDADFDEFTSCAFASSYIVAVSKNNFGIVRINSESGHAEKTWSLQ